MNKKKIIVFSNGSSNLVTFRCLSVEKSKKNILTYDRIVKNLSKKKTSLVKSFSNKYKNVYFKK